MVADGVADFIAGDIAGAVVVARWLARALISSGEWVAVAAALVMAWRRTALPFLPILLPEMLPEWLPEILPMPGRGTMGS